MTTQLEIGDILQLSDSRRLVYLGNGRATSQKLMVAMWPNEQGERPETWTDDKVGQSLTDAQISHWLNRKGA